MIAPRFVVGIVAFLAVLGAGLWLGYRWAAPPADKSHGSQVDVVDQVKRISELAAITFHVEVIDHQKPGVEFGYASYEAFLVWKGSVKAGVDLDEASFEVKAAEPRQEGVVLAASSDRSGDPEARPTVIATLPPSKILSVTYDNKTGWTPYVYYTSPVGKSVQPETFAAWMNWGNDKLEKDAKDHGILKQADQRVRELIGNYLSALGYDVEFKSA